MLKIFSTEWLATLRSNRPGEIVKCQVDTNSNITQLTTIIPADDTIPQITEGDQIFDVNYTPKAIGNKIVITTGIMFSETSNIGNSFAGALFVDNGVNAVAVDSVCAHNGNSSLTSGRIQIIHTTVITSLAMINLKVRVGGDASGANWALNKAGILGSSKTFGNTISSYIRIEEIQA